MDGDRDEGNKRFGSNRYERNRNCDGNCRREEMDEARKREASKSPNRRHNSEEIVKSIRMENMVKELEKIEDKFERRVRKSKDSSMIAIDVITRDKMCKLDALIDTGSKVSAVSKSVIDRIEDMMGEKGKRVF